MHRALTSRPLGALLPSRLSAPLVAGTYVGAIGGLRERQVVRPAAFGALGAGGGAQPVFAVLAHVTDDRQQRAALLGERILDARRNLWKGVRSDDRLLLQRAQAQRERARADPRERAFELAEARAPSASSRTSSNVHLPHTISAVRHTGHVSSTAISTFTLPSEVTVPGTSAGGTTRGAGRWGYNVAIMIVLAASGLAVPIIVVICSVVLLAILLRSA